MTSWRESLYTSAKQGRVVAKITYFLLAISFAASTSYADSQPKLIVQITVDALRGDFPTRYQHVLGDGGFRYLLDKGIYYRNAYYQHANTETIVGHVSLATGALPATHGMVGNVWFDREQGRLVYNIEDADYKLLSANADVDNNTEIDPTQKAAKVDGRSPSNILSSTFSDEMAIYYAGASKIFSVSIKDRGAVSMAGQTGKAFWFSKTNGEFVTSNYYYDQYPKWVNDWNANKPTAAYSGKQWQLTHPSENYIFGKLNNRDYVTKLPGFGQSFPHAYGDSQGKYFTTLLTTSPAGDELTLKFAKTLVEKEQLGQNEAPDYLAISFSSTDYVGHLFGASSLESEDNFARLDRTLASLFSFIDDKVGLENTLIVLSSDHGQPEVPGYLNELGIKDAAHFDMDSLDKTPIIAAIKKRFGIEDGLVEAFFQPYIYLNQKTLKDKGIDADEVAQTVAEELMKVKGIAYAISSASLSTTNLPDQVVKRAIQNNFHPKRSGDIYVVFEPNVFISDFDGLDVASVHGSPWRYDSFVPVIFAGAGLLPASVNRSITPYDIAPTLSAFIGSKPPSGAFGAPLLEVLEN
jgi:predicted AlkP superfamily pyrophosphatase or phosphodiesterase